ncbi:hypothetical protein SK128_013410 [Halocaridina rubra]|uniref:Uncharacterized protein n=1 Tax=Halocaridina rubra TaxID=373956 RepID=A0AAN9AGF3_HALRR
MSSSFPVVTLMTFIGLLTFPQSISGTTTGLTQTSFFSTDSGFSGATSSSFVGPDGIRKGECSYTNKEGRSVTIKFEETAGGQVTARTESNDVTDADAELKICQAEIAQLEQNLSTSFQESQQRHSESMAELEANMRDQMALFNRQQESFAEQHRQFLRQMSDFNKKMEEQSRQFQQSFRSQQQPINPFGFSFF